MSPGPCPWCLSLPHPAVFSSQCQALPFAGPLCSPVIPTGHAETSVPQQEAFFLGHLPCLGFYASVSNHLEAGTPFQVVSSQEFQTGCRRPVPASSLSTICPHLPPPPPHVHMGARAVPAPICPAPVPRPGRLRVFVGPGSSPCTLPSSSSPAAQFTSPGSSQKSPLLADCNCRLGEGASQVCGGHRAPFPSPLFGSWPPEAGGLSRSVWAGSGQ